MLPTLPVTLLLASKIAGELFSIVLIFVEFILNLEELIPVEFTTLDLLLDGAVLFKE